MEEQRCGTTTGGLNADYAKMDHVSYGLSFFGMVKFVLIRNFYHCVPECEDALLSKRGVMWLWVALLRTGMTKKNPHEYLRLHSALLQRERKKKYNPPEVESRDLSQHNLHRKQNARRHVISHAATSRGHHSRTSYTRGHFS